MRISIRRCLSMLRNTSDGNELAVPALNAFAKEHSVSAGYGIEQPDKPVTCASIPVGLTLRWHR